MDTYLIKNETHDGLKEIQTPLGKLVYFSRKAPYRSEKQANQDSAGIFILKNRIILLVADGMGGHEGGDKASALVVDTFAEELKNKGDISEAILVAIEAANQKVNNMDCGAGSTLVLADITPETLRFYNLGDSLGIVLGRGGEPKFKVIEQSEIGMVNAAGLKASDIKKDEEDLHHVLNGIGFEYYFIETSRPVDFKHNDVVLLSSDGFSNNYKKDLSNEWQEKGLMGKANSWVDKALGKMETDTGIEDDLTFLALQKNSIADK